MKLLIPFFSVSLGKNCFDSETGLGYDGTQSRTPSGRTCMRWDASRPHKPLHRPTGSDNENYCRNPKYPNPDPR